MKAVCFKCGGEKTKPLKMCSHCQALPQSRKDRIKSMCLSRTCLKSINLIKASNYIKLKGRPPGFHDKVISKATRLVDSLSELDDSNSQSYEFSDSFFEFEGLESRSSGEKIIVHAIGKPADDSVNSFADNNNPTARSRTYHKLEWEIGKEIEKSEIDIHGNSGEIFVWYRWLDNKWAWKCVSKPEFQRMRDLER